jgi:hypothetical protein
MIRHRPQWRRLQQSLFSAGTCLPSRCLATISEYSDRPTDFLLIRYGQHRKWSVQQFYSCKYTLPQERSYWAATAKFKPLIFSRMRSGRWNRSIRRKPVSLPVCASQILHDLNWGITRAARCGGKPANNRLSYITVSYMYMLPPSSG